MSGAYTDYLRTGEGKVFAPGPRTSLLREERDKLRRTPTFWTEFIDTPEKAPASPPRRCAPRTAGRWSSSPPTTGSGGRWPRGCAPS
ncbi:hypothetical protein ACFQ2B_23010 [Streptomyces stramineus]